MSKNQIVLAKEWNKRKIAGATIREIALESGAAIATVQMTISLLKLPFPIQALVARGELSWRAALVLLKLPTHVLREKITLDQVKSLSRKKMEKFVFETTASEETAFLIEAAARFSERIGVKVEYVDGKFSFKASRDVAARLGNL